MKTIRKSLLKGNVILSASNVIKLLKIVPNVLKDCLEKIDYLVIVWRGTMII